MGHRVCTPVNLLIFSNRRKLDDTEWASFPNNPQYAVSREGEVRNLKFGRLRTPSTDRTGRKRVTMYENGLYVSYYLHRVVAELFLEDYEPGLRIRFLNSDRSDCRAENLAIFENLKRRSVRLMQTRHRIHARRVLVVELGMVFRNAVAASAYIGGDTATVYKCLRGERNTHLGYTFRYQNTQEALAFLRRSQDYI